MDKQYVVGTNSLSYPQVRNFAGLPFQNFKVKKIYDICKIIDFAFFKLLGRNNLFFLNTFFDLGLNDVDILHFFNTVSFSRKPWVVTYESWLPAYNPVSEMGLKALA